MKKRRFEKAVTAKHWKTECNQKTKTVNFCKIVNFICKKIFWEIKHIFENNMSYVSLPFGLILKDKQIKLDLPKNYAASQYKKRLLYIEIEDTNFQNKIIDLVNNRTDLQKYLLATSGYGDFIQEKINTIVDDGKYNHAMVRRALDEKIKGLLQYGNP